MSAVKKRVLPPPLGAEETARVPVIELQLEPTLDVSSFLADEDDTVYAVTDEMIVEEYGYEIVEGPEPSNTVPLTKLKKSA